MAKGTKRPRKSTQREIDSTAAASAAPGTSVSEAGPSSTTGPRDIIKPSTSVTALAQDDIAAYSATPPTLPARKLSRNSVASSTRTDEDDAAKDPPMQQASSASSSALHSRPIKSALASSARLASMGPSGGAGSIVSSAYKKSMYVAYVKNALEQREKGKTQEYSDLVSQFRSSALALNSSSSSSSNTQALSLWLFALSYHVSKLDASHHSHLVENILDLPWAGASEDFVKSWCRFVCALVSARTEWAGSVLTRIVKAFRWRSEWLPLQPLNAPPSSTNGEASKRPTRRLLYARIHFLLKAILSLIPTLPSTLSPLLLRYFPHKRDGKKEQATYARNILFITLYENQVAEAVWRAVADRAIGLDVEIQIELDELEDGVLADGIEEDLANLDPFDRPLDQDDDDSSDEEDDEDGGLGDDGSDAGGMEFDDISDEDVEPEEDDAIAGAMLHEQEEERKARKVREMVGKLDALLKVCFEHLHRVGKGKHHAGGAEAESRQIFGAEFEKVLTTRENWLQDFLGTSRSNSSSTVSTPLGTPSSKRNTSQSGEIAAKVDEGDTGILDDALALSNSQRVRSASPAASSSSSATSTGHDPEAFDAARHFQFQHLLHLFSRSILPTFKCRHVQFLLFWYCSLESDFADYFLGLLIHKAIYSSPAEDAQSVPGQDKGSRADPMVLRQAAASYVASFVSRARYISSQYTRTVVLNLCSFLEAHIDEHANAVRDFREYGRDGVSEATARLAAAPPGSEEHAIFYAVAQAVFYIFCFRWQDLQNTGVETAKISNSSVGGKNGAQRRGSDALDDDLLDADPGFMFGSLSSTGSSSFALPSTLHRPPGEATGKGQPSPSPNLLAADYPGGARGSVAYPLSPSLSATVVPPVASQTEPSSENSAWSAGLSILQHAIVCPLNPLQFCSSTVVQQFASVAQHVGFLYCWSVIDANRRGGAGNGEDAEGGVNGKPSRADAVASSRVTRTNNATKALTKDLEGFFPFDPYRLRGTADKFVQPLYREWKDVVPSGLDDDDDETDDGTGADETATSSDGSDLSDDGDNTEDEIVAAMSPVNARPGRDIPGPGASRGGDADDDAATRSFAKSMEAMSVSAS